MGGSGGFSPKALAFFDGLEEDNSREYWTAHADTFEREIRQPLAALLESLPAAYQPFRVFRMNRDLRFAKDKSPYKLQHSATHEDGGIDHYVQVSAAGLLAASGIYWMQRDQLERYRAAVDDGRSGAALERLLARVPDSMSTDMGIDSLKTAPRGYPATTRGFSCCGVKASCCTARSPDGPWRKATRSAPSPSRCSRRPDP